jgi:hypothetical protein
MIRCPVSRVRPSYIYSYPYYNTVLLYEDQPTVAVFPARSSSSAASSSTYLVPHDTNIWGTCESARRWKVDHIGNSIHTAPVTSPLSNGRSRIEHAMERLGGLGGLGGLGQESRCGRGTTREAECAGPDWTCGMVYTREGLFLFVPPRLRFAGWRAWGLGGFLEVRGALVVGGGRSTTVMMSWKAKTGWKCPACDVCDCRCGCRFQPFGSAECRVQCAWGSRRMARVEGQAAHEIVDVEDIVNVVAARCEIII